MPQRPRVDRFWRLLEAGSSRDWLRSDLADDLGSSLVDWLCRERILLASGRASEVGCRQAGNPDCVREVRHREGKPSLAICGRVGDPCDHGQELEEREVALVTVSENGAVAWLRREAGLRGILGRGHRAGIAWDAGRTGDGAQARDVVVLVETERPDLADIVLDIALDRSPHPITLVVPRAHLLPRGLSTRIAGLDVAVVSLSDVVEVEPARMRLSPIAVQRLGKGHPRVTRKEATSRSGGSHLVLSHEGRELASSGRLRELREQARSYDLFIDFSFAELGGGVRVNFRIDGKPETARINHSGAEALRQLIEAGDFVEVRELTIRRSHEISHPDKAVEAARRKFDRREPGGQWRWVQTRRGKPKAFRFWPRPNARWAVVIPRAE